MKTNKINFGQTVTNYPINYIQAQYPNQQPVVNNPAIYNENAVYPQIKDDKNFQELSNSKFFKGYNLGYLMASLKNDREIKITTNYNPYQSPYGIVDYFYMPPKIDYKKYDISDYLKQLNGFVKFDKISDDLKQYYLQQNVGKLEIYYTKLDKIPTAKTKEEALNILMTVN